MKNFISQIEKDTANKNIDTVFIDATHLTPKARKKIYPHIDKNVFLVCVWFDIPKEEVLKRNAQRRGREFVPTNVIEQMFDVRVKPQFSECDLMGQIITVKADGSEIIEENL